MQEEASFTDENGNKLRFEVVAGAGYVLHLNGESFQFDSSKDVKRVQRDQNAKIKAVEN